MANYSADAYLVQNKFDLPFYENGADSARCLSNDTLKEIADIWGDNWFVRNFVEGDEVSFLFDEKMMESEHPERMRLLCHADEAWGIAIVRGVYEDSQRRTHISWWYELINLDTGECKDYKLAGTPLNENVITIYNYSPILKSLATNTGINICITPMKNLLNGMERLYVLKFILNITVENGGMFSMDGESIITETAREVGYVKPQGNLIALVRYMYVSDNYVLSSLGSIMKAIIDYDSSDKLVEIDGEQYSKVNGLYYRVRTITE